MSGGPQFTEYASQENVVTNAAPASSNTQYYIIGGIAVLIILVLVLVYYFYFSKSNNTNNNIGDPSKGKTVEPQKPEPPKPEPQKTEPQKTEPQVVEQPAKKVRFEDAPKIEELPDTVKSKKPTKHGVEDSPHNDGESISPKHDNVKTEPNLEELEQYTRL